MFTLEEVRRSPVIALPTGADGEYYYTAELSLPCGSIHKIGFTYDDGLSTHVVTTSDLEVPESFRHNGFAKRLLRAGFALAKLNAVYTSKSHVSSPYSLMARRSIFGDDNLTICDDDRDATPLDITVDEAIDSLENGEREYGFVVVSSLVDVDTVGWEPSIAG